MLRITARHFCAGVIIGVRAAPIIKYMETWSEAKIRMYCQTKGWVVD